MQTSISKEHLEDLYHLMGFLATGRRNLQNIQITFSVKEKYPDGGSVESGKATLTTQQSYFIAQLVREAVKEALAAYKD